MVKHTRHIRTTPGSLATVLALISLAAGAVLLPSAVDAGQTANGWVLTEPKRRAPDAPLAAAPSLPAGAQSIEPTTFDIVLRRESPLMKGQVVRQTVSRTSEQIHLRGNDNREWLFERNPIDHRRVSATLIDHSSKAIVLYEETDLRMTLGIRGWADVLALGFDSQTLRHYKRTAETRAVGTMSFVRYVSTATSGSVDEVWWSEEQVLPSRFSIGEGGGRTRFSIERVRGGTDASVLRPATARFPEYSVYDLAGWLEKH